MQKLKLALQPFTNSFIDAGSLFEVISCNGEAIFNHRHPKRSALLKISSELFDYNFQLGGNNQKITYDLAICKQYFPQFLVN